MHDEPRWADVGLDHIFKLRASVFEAGRWMVNDGFGEDFVEFGGFDFLMTSGVNLGSEFKKFSDVLTGFATGNKYGSVREKVEVVFEFVEDFVSIID